MHTHIIVIEATPGRCEELGGYLRDLLEPVRRSPGCIAFDLQREQRRWTVQGRWRSRAALDAYLQGEPLQQVLDSAWRSGAVRQLGSRAA